MALYFSVLLYSGAQMEALRTVMVFTVAVGFAKSINFSSQTLFTCALYLGFGLMVFGSSFCITIKFNDYDIKNLIVMQKPEARTVGLKPT